MTERYKTVVVTAVASVLAATAPVVAGNYFSKQDTATSYETLAKELNEQRELIEKLREDVAYLKGHAAARAQNQSRLPARFDQLLESKK